MTRRLWLSGCVIALQSALCAGVAASQGGADCNGNGFADTLEADEDGDGIIDACDNCRNVANPGQRDTDEDDIGNFCDPDLNNDWLVNFGDLGLLKQVFFTTDPDGDFDGDGVVSFADLGIMKSMFFGEPGPGAGPVGEALRPRQRADLAIVAIEPSEAYPVPGQDVSVTVRVTSAESEGAVGLATVTRVALYANDDLVEEADLPIESGSAAEFDFLWTPAVEGIHRLSAAVDPEGLLAESMRSDNSLHLDVAVAAPPPAGADFAVAGLQLISQPGRPFIPLVTVRNNGTATASAPLTLSANGDELSTRIVADLQPDESARLQFDWPGSQAIEQLHAVINPRFVGLEPVGLDNAALTDFRDPVDLAVERLSVMRLPPLDGMPYRATISFRVRNVGANDVDVVTTTRMEISAIDVARIDIPTPPVDAGETVYVSETVPFPQFSLAVTADHPHTLNEADRQNNIAVAEYQATGATDQWTTIGPGLITDTLGATGRIMTIAIDPSDPDVLYAGAVSGSRADRGGTGIWKTSDAGASWEPVGDSLPTLAIRALGVDPNVPSRVYAAMQERGIVRSNDGGHTWEHVNATDLRPRGNAGIGLLVDPSQPARVFLRSDDGLYRSTNFGVDWTLVLDENGAVLNLEQDPSNPAHLWAAVQAADPARRGIYESFDSGTSWSPAPVTGCPGDDLPDAVNADTTVRIARSGQRLYAMYREDPPAEDTNGDGTADRNVCRSVTVYRTTDTSCVAGGTVQRAWEQGWRTTDDSACSELWSGFYANPTDPDYLYATGLNLWLSEDGGDTFAVRGGLQPHADHHAFAADPADGTIVYVGNDGGVYRSTDRGRENTWSFAGEGMAITEFYDLADSATEPSVVIGGTQDNGTIKTTGDFVWSHIRGGDGATVAIDPFNPLIMYSMEQFADSLRRSTDGGAGGFPEDLALPVPRLSCRNLPYQLHPTLSSMLLASCTPGTGPAGLWDITAPLGSWQVIFTPPTGAIAASPSRSSAVDPSIDLYLAGTSSGQVHAGPGGADWRLVFNLGANSRVTDIEVDPDDPRTIFVAFHRTGSKRIYRLRRSSSDPTQADTSAIDITSDLPVGLKVRAVAVDRRNDQTILAGTNRGVFRGRSYDGGATWTWDDYSFGLPAAVDVSDFEVSPLTGAIRAGTLGRGAYEIQTDTPIGSLLAAEGRISLLRLHDVGTGFGPPGDAIDGEVIVRLDTLPDKAFGFTLRDDSAAPAHRGMLDVLRSALSDNRRVRIEYQLTGIGDNFTIIRVIELFGEVAS